MVFLAHTETNRKPEPEVAQDRPHSGKMPQQRILYAVGPGDVAGQYRDLLAGKEPPFQLGMSFSQQFLEACDAVGASAHLVSWHARRDRLDYGPHRLENRPQPSLYYAHGLKHYLGTVLYGLGIVAQAVREHATVVIVDSGTTHWFVLSLLSLFRIPVIPVLYSALWPMGFPPTRKLDKILLSLDGFFFRRSAAATVCMSPELERQAQAVAGRRNGVFFQFRPQYRQNFLSRVAPVPSWPFHPFHVLFLGRVEEFKGVFLMLSMAERLEKQFPGQFNWRIIGAGAAFDALQARIRERNLGHIVEARGMLPSEEATLETMGWAHAMIVPTTSQFKEGLAMTAAESVLAGRPVVMSSVVPAWEVLDRAAIKAETGSADSFVGIFRRLAQDAEYYEQHRRATAEAQAQFYDRSQGLGAVLMRAVAALR
jgi:glycogen(starch) synthase